MNQAADSGDDQQHDQAQTIEVQSDGNLEVAHVQPWEGASVGPLGQIERGLFLHAAGPASLPVQSDLVNVQRIAQNLLLNALKYTQRGGVRVSWQALETDGLARWAFIIEDTGPGMQAGGAAPLAEAIEASTEEAKAVEQSAVDSAERLDPPAHSSSAIFTAGTARSDTFSTPGEGIGLAIVKRLCELLDATIELQTEFGRGSVFRVILPRSYERE